MQASELDRYLGRKLSFVLRGLGLDQVVLQYGYLEDTMRFFRAPWLLFLDKDEVLGRPALHIVRCCMKEHRR
jgi:hypothetical protein